jgi:hypothetical protein
VAEPKSDPMPSDKRSSPRDDRSVAHVANVAWPTPGLCFRMVADPTRGGYPTRCPTPPRWRGVFVNPRGARWPVEACDEHAEGLDQLRPTRRSAS